MLYEVITIAKDWLPAGIAASGMQAVVFGLVLIGFIIFEPMGLYGRWLKIRTYLELFPFYRRGMFRRVITSYSIHYTKLYESGHKSWL